jgi:hypothetical protein
MGLLPTTTTLLVRAASLGLSSATCVASFAAEQALGTLVRQRKGKIWVLKGTTVHGVGTTMDTGKLETNRTCRENKQHLPYLVQVHFHLLLDVLLPGISFLYGNLTYSTVKLIIHSFYVHN